MVTYDHITDQFAPQFSPLAKRIYAVIFEATSKTGASIYVSSSDLIDMLDIDVVSLDSPGMNALIELLAARLIGFDDDNCFRYYVSPRAWRAHLLAERTAKEARDVPSCS